jgi:hypothetical protein
MNLSDYFSINEGRGIFSSAGRDGKVTAAVYSTPHICEDGTVAFIMRQHLTHANLQDNPHAVFLFIEEGPGTHGVRLYLKKVREDSDPTLLAAMTRRHLTPAQDQALGPKFIAYFEVEKIINLVGDGIPDLQVA